MIAGKNIILILLLLLYSCSLSANRLCKNGETKADTVKFIVIANVGASNYSIPQLVISTDTIDSIPYRKGVYDQYIIFSKYHNIVISQEMFNKLFSHFGVIQVCDERPDKFIREAGAVLIVDYRSSSGKNCELLTIRNVSVVFYTLQNLYCYLQSNKFDKEILTYIKTLYKFYLKTYDYNGERYKSEIICD